MNEALSKDELKKIQREMSLLAEHNELLNAEIPDEQEILTRNLSRLYVLQARVLKSLRAKQTDSPLRMIG